MNIIIKNDYRAEILLTDAELREMDITYEELDYGNVETRRVLWTLLDEVRKRYGTDIDLSGKLLIEVCKEPNDKYRICFTSLPSRTSDTPSVKQLVKTCTEPIALECTDIDTTVEAAAKTRFNGKSSLYTYSGAYRLLIYAPAEMKPSLYAVLGEYGTILNNINGSITAECEEYWKLIEEEHAIAKLRTLI